MSCVICDIMKKDGIEHITEGGRFTFFLEYGQKGDPMIVVRDKYKSVGGNGIRLKISNCPLCGEKLEKRS